MADFELIDDDEEAVTASAPVTSTNDEDVLEYTTTADNDPVYPDENQVEIPEEQRTIEELPVTTIDDAYESLYERQDAADMTKILDFKRLDAEENLLAGFPLDEMQEFLLLPPTERTKQERVQAREGMTLPQLIADLKLERYEAIDSGEGIIAEEMDAATQEKLDRYNKFFENAKEKLDKGNWTQEKYDNKVAEALADYEAGLGGDMFAATGAEAAILTTDQRKELVDRAFEKADYYLNNRNTYMRELARNAFLPVELGYMSVEEFNAAMFTDEFFDPVNAFMEVPHNWGDMQENIRAGNYKAAAFDALNAGLNLATAVPGARVLTKSVNAGWKRLSGGKGAYNDVMAAMAAENSRAYDIKKATRRMARDNPDVRNQIIKEFEERFNVTISTTDDKGNLRVDPKLVRETGKAKVSDYFIDMGFVGTDNKAVKLTDYAINDESLAIPILDPEKMDMFVSVVVGLKKNEKFAEALKTKGDERLVDKLFELTMNEDLLGSEELLEQLTKNGLAFEEYVLGVVGSGSEAGRIMNRLSQMATHKPKSVKEAQELKAKIETQRAFGRLWSGTVLRAENLRRGLMVSSLATAVRNYQSGLIRAPMESLADVMDTALLTYGNARTAGVGKGESLLKFHNAVNPLIRDGTWSGAFRNMRYIMADQQRAAEFTDYILDRPQFAEQFERMFNQFAEIQEYTQKGKAQTFVGKQYDKVMTRAEDLVWTLNGPNRWQEHMIRRATFLGELERQVKVNWNMDLQTALKEGKIEDMIKSAPSVRPNKDAPTFESMIETSVNKALDVTYAKQPDFEPFKRTTEIITKTGLTAVVPFPRFMFNAMEYMAQNTGGALLVPIRKAVSKESRDAGLTARDRQDITRNLVGIATMSALYQVKQQYGTNDYTMVADDQNQVDISAQFPLRQMGWITDFIARQQEGTLETWYGMNGTELAETWLGTTARTGVGNVFVEEIGNIIMGTEDIIDDEARKKAIGRLVGQYAATYITPAFQLTEAQRVQGIRGEEAKDFKGSIPSDANLPFAEDSGVRSFYEVFAQRGAAAPSFEEELNQRVAIDKGKIQRPDSAWRLYLGLTVTKRDSDITDYLKEIGYEDATYELGSKSRVSANKIAENEYISAAFPTLVEVAKEFSEEMHPNDKKEQHLLARKEIRNSAMKLREQFNDPYLGDVSPVAVVVDELSRLSKEDRRYGIVTFKDNNDGRLPDITNLEDLMEYAEYCKIHYLD